VATDRERLVRILQDAHAGELAAAYAYRGHAKAVRRESERTEILRIEASEWHHRALVAAPRRPRELLMASVGRFFGALCFVGGWFGPMYAAGRLEGMNVGQYADARTLAVSLGLHDYVRDLDAMVREEERHELWFGDRVRGHRLLRPAVALFRWRPPPV
jgi:demethoxyubiquinone hydroxylase (CLK1/Coq7/Cat5 family)